MSHVAFLGVSGLCILTASHQPLWQCPGQVATANSSVHLGYLGDLLLVLSHDLGLLPSHACSNLTAKVLIDHPLNVASFFKHVLIIFAVIQVQVLLVLSVVLEVQREWTGPTVVFVVNIELLLDSVIIVIVNLLVVNPMPSSFEGVAAPQAVPGLVLSGFGVNFGHVFNGSKKVPASVKTLISAWDNF